MKTEGHTPTPWYADPDDREGYEWNIHILQESDPNIRVCFMSNGPATEANAHLIVTAVNERSALLRCEAELRRLIKYANWQLNEGASHHPTLRSSVDAARAALTLLDEARK